MSAQYPLIAAWARSAVVPRHGAFKTLQTHELAAPVIHALLTQAELSANAVDAVVMGNALGAGGNPARMLALHAGLNTSCAAYTVDTQCCAGLDAVAIGAALITSGQAHVVIAGGAEAWSRSPIRMHRPLNADEPAVAFERPAFAPTPEQDPDMLLSAARYAAHAGYTRTRQEDYAVQSHARAVEHQSLISTEIVPILNVAHDVYPRHIDATRAARMPEVASTDALHADNTCALSALTVSAQADGAAFVLLVSPQACETFKLTPKAQWITHASTGCTPETPLLAAQVAALQAIQRAGVANAKDLAHVELHDAFAVQGLSFAENLDLRPEQLNAHGGGLCRGHPIGASAAVALVRLLTDLTNSPTANVMGLVAVAGAGGLGSAAVVVSLAP
jgi:acetyl-CoA C-acetyltransferase